MPYVKLYEESEEGNFYPKGNEHFVSDEILKELVGNVKEDEFWDVNEMNEDYRSMRGYSSIVDQNGNF